jgi:hypothetical protein
MLPSTKKTVEGDLDSWGGRTDRDCNFAYYTFAQQARFFRPVYGEPAASHRPNRHACDRHRCDRRADDRDGGHGSDSRGGCARRDRTAAARAG